MDAVATEGRFRAAHGVGETWSAAVDACLAGLGDTAGANLGLLYVTAPLEDAAADILARLRDATGIADWAGTVGLGVCAGEHELFDRPAVAVLTARLPDGAFHLVPTLAGEAANRRLPRAFDAWAAQARPVLGLVHGDPRNPDIPDAVAGLAAETGAFLVGGLSSGHAAFPQVCGGVTDGGVSGVLFGAEVPVLTGLSQGCSPIGPVRTVTAARRNIIAEIDGRPALEVFKEDIGELLARDLRRVAGYIFTALPVTGSDTGDYLVRNIVAIDPASGLMAIGEEIDPGRPILFTRRDRAAAVQDLDRMLTGLTRRLNGRRPQGAVYVSCLARGPNLFGSDSEELRQVQAALGDIPLVGFFANGEISHDRLYGYTGVLTVFL